MLIALRPKALLGSESVLLQDYKMDKGICLVKLTVQSIPPFFGLGRMACLHFIDCKYWDCCCAATGKERFIPFPGVRLKQPQWVYSDRGHF